MGKLNEYQHYSKVAIDLFNYMNGRINTMNICTFRTELYDYNGRAYGNINYPNDVYINIGTIIDSWNDDWSDGVVGRHDYICTMIAWTIAHELFHADQLISMMTYNHDPQYKLKVEGDVQRASYDWIMNNSRKLGEIGNFKCQIRYITAEVLPDVSDYRKATVKEYYLQTIANVILRDLQLFSQLEIFHNDNSTNSILVVFNNTDSVYIKQNGQYLAENVGLFSQLTYKYAGQYNRYSVSIASKMYENRNWILNIQCTEPMVDVMRFRK